MKEQLDKIMDFVRSDSADRELGIEMFKRLLENFDGSLSDGLLLLGVDVSRAPKEVGYLKNNLSAKLWEEGGSTLVDARQNPDGTITRRYRSNIPGTTWFISKTGNR